MYTEYETDIINVFAAFVRYLYSFESKVFISYFSYHLPVIPFLDCDNIEEDVDLQNVCLVPGDLSK